MPLRNCQNWIFDMDGTLTQPVHDFEEIRTILGIPSQTPILEYIQKLPEFEAKQVKQRLDDLEMEIAHDAVAQAGVPELLAELKDQGRKLGILTRNSEGIAHVTLKACGLLKYFEPQNIIGRETCQPKPLPDGIHHLIDLWQARVGETVMVGDYLYDIEAGRRAGVHTVHFDSTAQFMWPELTDFKISKMVDLKLLYSG